MSMNIVSVIVKMMLYSDNNCYKWCNKEIINKCDKDVKVRYIMFILCLYDCNGNYICKWGWIYKSLRFVFDS